MYGFAGVQYHLKIKVFGCKTYNSIAIIFYIRYEYIVIWGAMYAHFYAFAKEHF